jgi:hypothetical protein
MFFTFSLPYHLTYKTLTEVEACRREDWELAVKA